MYVKPFRQVNLLSYMNHSRHTVLWALISQIKEWKIQSGERPGCFPMVNLALPHPLKWPLGISLSGWQPLTFTGPSMQTLRRLPVLPYCNFKVTQVTWHTNVLTNFQKISHSKYLVSWRWGALVHSCTCRRYAVSPCCHFKGIRSLFFSEELGISNIWNFKN